MRRKSTAPSLLILCEPAVSIPRSIKQLSAEQRAKIIVTDELVKPDEWFTQEVIAQGNHIIIKLNGKTTVDFVDENNTYTKGHLALQQHNAWADLPETVLHVRKIEIRELLPAKSP